MQYTLSHHARGEMERRGIPLALLESALQHPQQIVPEQGGAKAYQSILDFGGKRYLLRAIIVDDRMPALVVTVYRTSKITKYWRGT